MSYPVPKLKLGVLVSDNLLVSAFERLALECVMRLECVESMFVGVVTVNQSDPAHRPVRRLPFLVSPQIERSIATGLFRAPNLGRGVSVGDLGDRCRFVPLRAERRKGLFDWFDERSIETLADCAPDILIRFTGRIVKGDVLQVPKYGLWSYHHADNRINRGGRLL